MSDSDSSNDFLLCLPWVVSSRLSGSWERYPEEGDTKLTQPRIYVAAEVEDVR